MMTNNNSYLIDQLEQQQLNGSFAILNRTILLKIFIGFLMCLISLTAIIGNILVIIAMKIDKNLRTVSNYFILSLSISDFLVGLFVMPLSATYTLFDQKWYFGKVICNIWLSLDYTASTASIFNLFALSVDRYLSINEPLKYISKSSKKRVFLSILIVWFISLLWLIPINYSSVFLTKHQHPYTILDDKYKCYTDFETNRPFKLVTTLVNFYIPLIGISLIYIRIFITIRNRSKIEFSRKFSNEIKNNCKKETTVTETTLTEHQTLTETPRNVSNADTNSHLAHNSTDLNKKDSLEVYGLVDRRQVPLHCSISDSKLYERVPTQMSLHHQQSQLHIHSDELKQIAKSPLRDTSIKSTSRFIYKYKSPISLYRKTNGSRHDSISSETRKKPLATVATRTFHLNIFCLQLNKRFSCKKNPKKIQYVRKRRNGLIVSQANIKITNVNKCSLAKLDVNLGKKPSFHYRSYNHALRKQIKAARQLGILLSAFLITWLPYFIVFIVVAFCIDCIPENIYTITIWLGYVNSAINPILYPLCNSAFKIAFRRMLRLSMPVYTRRNFMQILSYTADSA